MLQVQDMPGGGVGDHVSIYLLYWPPKTGIIYIVSAQNRLVVYHTHIMMFLCKLLMYWKLSLISSSSFKVADFHDQYFLSVHATTCQAPPLTSLI